MRSIRPIFKALSMRKTPVILQSTDHGLIPAANASLSAVHGSTSGSNVRYYPTWKYSTLKKRNEQGCYNASKLLDVSSRAVTHHVFLSLTTRKSSVHLYVLYFPCTALRTFTPRKDQLVISRQYLNLFYQNIPFEHGLQDDGGSTHLWNVGRQSFYTAV
jgi:hypothetical protein